MGDEDRSGFLSLLGTAVGESRVRCLDHCLMGNHYHLVLEVLAEPLGDVMRDVLSVYAADFNDRYGREGHLFERRYWAKCVDSPRYLRELVRYIAMNPVRAGLCARPEDWPWSGHRALMGLAPAGITATDALLAHFGPDQAAGRANYDAWISEVRDARAVAIGAVTVTIDRDRRREAIRAAHARGGSTQEIAAAAGCSIRTIQRAVGDKTL